MNSADFGNVSRHAGGKPGADAEGVALAVLQALDAELLVLGGNGGLVGAALRDERREIGALGEFFRELEADAGRGGIGIDGVIEQAEAMIGAQLLVLAADIGGFAQVEGQPQRVERGAPQLALAERVAERRQRLGLLARGGRALVGDVGGRRGALQKQRPLAVIGRAHLQDGAGEAQPVRGILGGERRDLAHDLQTAAQVGAPQRRFGIRPQRRQRLADGARLALDLGFQPDGGISEIVAAERLVGGHCGNGMRRQRDCQQRGANETSHVGSSLPLLPSAVRPEGVTTLRFGSRRPPKPQQMPGT